MYTYIFNLSLYFLHTSFNEFVKKHVPTAFPLKIITEL